VLSKLKKLFLFKWKSNSNAKPGHAELHQPNHVSDSSNLNDEKSALLGRRLSSTTESSRHVLSEEEAKILDQECMQRFLKINCKIVTRSKGCHEGVCFFYNIFLNINEE
jgi:hypothetical protein